MAEKMKMKNGDRFEVSSVFVSDGKPIKITHAVMFTEEHPNGIEIPLGSVRMVYR